MNTVLNLEKYGPLLAQCQLFHHIRPGCWGDALRFLRARTSTVARGECINRPGEAFRLVGLVLEGGLECAFENEHCDHIIMNHFRQGQLFGLSMACAQVACCPMRLRAVSECAILFLDCRALLEAQPLCQPWQARLAANCIHALAQQNVFLNLKVRILGQRGIRDKVFVYLRSLPPQKDGGVLVPFTRTALAEFLGVNRSALSRELRRMAEKGLLVMHGQNFRLLA